MALRSGSCGLAGRRPHDRRPRSHTKRSHGHARSRIKRPGSNFQITFARAQVSRHLGHRFLYYLTPEEAHQRIDAVEQDRNRLFLRLFWEMSARVSEAIAIKPGDVSRTGIRGGGGLGGDLYREHEAQVLWRRKSQWHSLLLAGFQVP